MKFIDTGLSFFVRTWYCFLSRKYFCPSKSTFVQETYQLSCLLLKSKVLVDNEYISSGKTYFQVHIQVASLCNVCHPLVGTKFNILYWPIFVLEGSCKHLLEFETVRSLQRGAKFEFLGQFHRMWNSFLQGYVIW